MERTDRINFNSLISKIQKCKMLDEYNMKLFLNECYDDLINRMEVDDDNNKLGEIIFNKYMNLPVVASDKIFSVFNESNTHYLTKKEFSDGMYNLYCSKSLEILQKLTFKIFCLNSKNIIIKEDIMILLTYMSCFEKIFKILDTAIEDFFQDSNELSFEQYSNIIENRNSSVFLILLIYLYESQPFNEEALQFFYQINNKTNSNEKSNVEKEVIINNKTIFNPENLLKYIFNVAEGKVSRKKSSRNLFKAYENQEDEMCDSTNNEKMNFIEFYNNDNEENEKEIEDSKNSLGSLNLSEIRIENKSVGQISSKSSSTISKKSQIKIPNTFSKGESFGSSSKFSNVNNTSVSADSDVINTLNNNKNYNKLSGFSQYISTNTNSDYIDYFDNKIHQQIVYKVKKDETVVKFQLVAINNILFSLVYSYNKKEYSISKIHPLNGYFFARGEETSLVNQKFYPLALLNKWGNSIANLRNIFFFNSKKERDDFIEILNRLMKIKEFKDDYEIISLIGKGQFGKVKLALCKKSNKKVAIKMIDKVELKQKEYDIVRAEIDLMKFLMNFNHPNIVIPIDILEDNQFIYIVMEYMHLGSLQKYLVSRGDLMNEKNIKKIAAQILEGLLFLSSVGIMHRDLKPENILVTAVNGKQINLKITDFGLSKVLGKHQIATESYGSLFYCAPEILLKKKYGIKIDSWSYGVVLFYMITGSLPFDGTELNSDEIAKKICNDSVHFPDNLTLSKEIKSLIKCCLNKNPSERFSFDQIKNSEWMINL